ncbi:MAG: type II secretion system GspH family protein [Proteobacteria bacterium]|nr:type II secretion system GspH family protein [Pseudomonadota bacterium]
MSHKRAFTLIEMAIVLVIMGLLIGLTMPVITEFIKRDKQSAGQASIDNLKEVILGYAIANGHLPEPNNLASLGLPLNDPWGQQILYITPDELDNKQEICHEDVTNTTMTYTEMAADTSTQLAQINNVGFALVSLGPNHTQEVVLTGAGPYTDLTAYPKGITGATLKPDDVVTYVTLDFLKGRVCAAGTSTGPIGADVSFAQNFSDFGAAAVTTPAAGYSAPTTGYVTTATDDNTVTLGDGLSGGIGCFWYKGNTAADSGACLAGECNLYPDDFAFAPLVEGGVRVYFEYTPIGSSGSGWTFTVASADPAAVSASASTDMCGGIMLGYSAWGGDIPTLPIYDPKFAVEFDYYQSTDDPNFNSGSYDPHLALVFWGSDYNPASIATQYATLSDDYRHGVNSDALTDPDNPDVPSGHVNESYDSGPPVVNDNPYYYNTTDDYVGDGQPHTFRMDVVITEDAANDVTYDWSVCIDCDNSNDLTQDFNDYGDWTTGKAFHLTEGPYPATSFHNNMKDVFFGWTTGTGLSVDRQVTISDFGIAFR